MKRTMQETVLPFGLERLGFIEIDYALNDGDNLILSLLPTSKSEVQNAPI
jgi:hypothetical protein